MRHLTLITTDQIETKEKTERQEFEDFLVWVEKEGLEDRDICLGESYNITDGGLECCPCPECKA